MCWASLIQPVCPLCWCLGQAISAFLKGYWIQGNKKVRKRKKWTNQWMDSGFTISHSSKSLLVISTFIFFLIDSKTVLKKTSMQPGNPKDNDEIEKRLGLNDSAYFMEKFLILQVSGVHVTLQATYVTIWLVTCSWAVHWCYRIVLGIWTVYICLYMYMYIHFKRAEEAFSVYANALLSPFLFFFFFFINP